MLGINSLFGKTIDSTAAMQRNRMKCFTCVVDSARSPQAAKPICHARQVF